MDVFKSRPIHTEFSLIDPERQLGRTLGFVLASDRQLSNASNDRLYELVVLVVGEYHLDRSDHEKAFETIFEFMGDMLKATFLELENDGTIAFIAFMCALYSRKVVNGMRELRNNVLKQETPDQEMEKITAAFRKAFHDKLDLLEQPPELTEAS
jgi:hypothetical protein